MQVDKNKKMERNPTVIFFKQMIPVVIATTSIVYAITAFVYGKIIEIKEERIEILRLENEILKKKIEGSILEKEKLEKRMLQKTGQAKESRRLPPTENKKCESEMRVFVRDALTNAPIKNAYVFNGGGRNFQAGYTDNEGKMTIYFNNQGISDFSMLFANKNNYWVYNEPVKICRSSPTEHITIFLQPKQN